MFELFVTEKAVADNLNNWAESNNKFNRQQNGFRKSWSTNDDLFKLWFSQRYLIDIGIFFYIKKAFDQVWFNELLFKLTSMGLNRKLIRWISNFLYLGKLMVSSNNQLSDSFNPTYGVSQGSLLSSISFILYASDIP